MFAFAKKWLVPLLLFATVLTTQASDKLLNSLQPRGFVNDFANVIPSAQERQLEQMLVSLERQTGAEVAVVTLTSLDGGQIDDFAVRLYERWKLGKAGKDNGVLLLAAINDRKARIEVGYGLEGAIPDGRAGEILRTDVFPAFKRGQYGDGLIAAASSISERVAREYGVRLQNQSVASSRYRESSGRTYSRRHGNPLLNIILFIGFIYMAIRHPRLLLFLLLTSGRGGGRGYSSGGFGGGGFGGFGGGSSGGGGASGGW